MEEYTNEFIKSKIVNTGIVYDESFIPYCHVTLVDPNNPEPIEIGLDMDSTRLTMIGAMQYLVEMGDPIAQEMSLIFMKNIDQSQDIQEQ